MTLYQLTAINAPERGETNHEAGDDKAEIKRLLSKLVNHYLEDTVTPRERQIQAQLLFIDLSTSLADDKARQTACREILKNILLGVLIPK